MKIYTNETIHLDPKLKQSFFNLANNTFQIDLKAWNALGYWDNSYNVHCLVQKNEIISNVSTSDALLIIDGQTYKTKQIGTVMTAPHARQSGYAKTLMHHVLKDNEQQDYLFLFANKHSASFYKQFGFDPIKQKQYVLPTSQFQFKQTEIKKLNFQDKKTRTFLLDILIHRLPVSTKLGVLQNEMIVLFNIMSTWQEHLYYVPALQTVVIGQQQANTFVLIDFISKQPILLKELIPYLKVTSPVIELHFTPSSLHGLESVAIENDYFYVRNQCDMPFPSNYCFPTIAKA